MTFVERDSGAVKFGRRPLMNDWTEVLVAGKSKMDQK